MFPVSSWSKVLEIDSCLRTHWHWVTHYLMIFAGACIVTLHAFSSPSVSICMQHQSPQAGKVLNLPLSVCLLMDGAMLRLLTGKLFALITLPHCGRCCVIDTESLSSFVIFHWSASGLAHTQSQPLVLKHLLLCFQNHSNYLSVAKCHTTELNQHQPDRIN